MTTIDRADRYAVGREAELAVIEYLRGRDCPFVVCGQERWMPKWVHKKLRTVHGHPMIDALRHYPDLASPTMLIQVKSAPNWDEHPTVTIEQASYRVSKELSDVDCPVLIVWYFPNKKPGGTRFLAQWASKINVMQPNGDRHDYDGSMTPMYLVNLKQLQSFDMFEVG